MVSGLQKAVAVIGGLIVGVGLTWFYSQNCTPPSCPLPNDLMSLIGIGAVVTFASGISLYFMFKGGGG